MPAVYRAQTKKPNRRKENNFPKSALPCPDRETFDDFQEGLRRLFRTTFWADGTSKNLGKSASITRRQANNILNRSQDVTLKALWPVFRDGQYGPQILTLLLLSVKAEWATAALSYQRVGEAKRKIELAQQELKELEGRS